MPRKNTNRTVAQLMRKIIMISVFTPVLALTLVIGLQVYQAANAHFDRDAQVRMRYVQQNIRDHDRSNREALAYFAELKIVADTIHDSKFKPDLMKAMVNYGDQFMSSESVALGTSDGRFYFKLENEIPAGFDPRVRPWYVEALKTPRSVVLTEPYVSTSHNVGQIEMTYAKAVIDERTGAVIGVAASATPLVMLNGILTNVQATDGAVTLICNKTGMILASSAKAYQGKIDAKIPWVLKILKATELTTRLTVDGNTYRVYKSVETSTGWIVVTMVPIAVIYREILSLLGMIVVVSVLAFMVPYFMAKEFSRDISGPVGRIETVLKAIWSGQMAKQELEFDNRIPMEIVAMGQAVTSMQELMGFRNSVIDNADIWLSVHDETGAMLLWNPAAAQMSGYESREVIGKTDIWSWLYPDPEYAAEMHAASVRVIEDGKGYEGFIAQITCKDGTHRHIAWDTKKVEFEGAVGACTLAMGVDVTRQVEAEASLLHLNADLEYKIQERTKDLDSTNRYLAETLDVVREKQSELETVNERLQKSLEELEITQSQLVISEKLAIIGELVAGMSHEINTPLGISVTLSTFLTENLKTLSHDFDNGRLTKTQFLDLISSMLEASALIDSNLKIASQLIVGFKEMARDQQVQEIRTVDLGHYIQETLISLKPKIKKTRHKMNLHCPDGISVSINPGAVSQIVTNLIINSLVHGFEGIEEGQMVLTVTQNEDWVTMVYSDNGVGIPDKILNDVFKPFFTTKKGLGTTGLGLHILKTIVEETLHGSIELQSESGKGVTFTIRFPASSPELKNVFGEV